MLVDDSIDVAGMPCSGPRTPLEARSASSALASLSALVLISRTDCSAGPSALVSAIRARYALVSVSALSVPAVMRSCSDFADSVSSENGSVGAVPIMFISVG